MFRATLYWKKSNIGGEPQKSPRQLLKAKKRLRRQSAQGSEASIVHSPKARRKLSSKACRFNFGSMDCINPLMQAFTQGNSSRHLVGEEEFRLVCSQARTSSPERPARDVRSLKHRGGRCNDVTRLSLMITRSPPTNYLTHHQGAQALVGAGLLVSRQFIN